MCLSCHAHCAFWGRESTRGVDVAQTGPLLSRPSPGAPAGAAGVAVAAFVKRATELRGQHVVIVCCGGNAAQETLDVAYGMVRARGSLAGSLHLG